MSTPSKPVEKKGEENETKGEVKGFDDAFEEEILKLESHEGERIKKIAVISELVKTMADGMSELGKTMADGGQSSFSAVVGRASLISDPACIGRQGRENPLRIDPGIGPRVCESCEFNKGYESNLTYLTCVPVSVCLCVAVFMCCCLFMRCLCVADVRLY